MRPERLLLLRQEKGYYRMYSLCFCNSDTINIIHCIIRQI